MNFGISLAENGWLPDSVTRFGIRRQLADRLKMERGKNSSVEDWANLLRASPIAIEQTAANEQHYEVPASFYEKVLGPHLKYS